MYAELCAVTTPAASKFDYTCMHVFVRAGLCVCMCVHVKRCMYAHAHAKWRTYISHFNFAGQATCVPYVQCMYNTLM